MEKNRRNESNQRRHYGKRIVILAGVFVLLTGCGQKRAASSIAVDNTNGADNSLNSATNSSDLLGADSQDPMLEELDLSVDPEDPKGSSTTETDEAYEAFLAEKGMASDSDAKNKQSLAEQSVQTSGDGKIDIDITEKMYVSWINEIYTNYESYLGKTVRLEGMYTSEYFDETKTNYSYVYRTGPGCCANDGSMCGFEFTYEGELPKDNDWIEVIGTVDDYTEQGEHYLVLRASKVTVKTKRGSETVTQ